MSCAYPIHTEGNRFVGWSSCNESQRIAALDVAPDAEQPPLQQTTPFIGICTTLDNLEVSEDHKYPPQLASSWQLQQMWYGSNAPLVGIQLIWLQGLHRTGWRFHLFPSGFC